MRITCAPVIKANESFDYSAESRARTASASLRRVFQSFVKLSVDFPSSLVVDDRSDSLERRTDHRGTTSREGCNEDASGARMVAAVLGSGQLRSSIHVSADRPGGQVAAVDDKRDTPISLMTSVNDFELFDTISGGLRYRRRLARAGSYDKTSAFRSLETTPFRGPRVLSCRPALSSSGRARRRSRET